MRVVAVTVWDMGKKVCSALLHFAMILFVTTGYGCAQQHAPLRDIDLGEEIRLSINDQEIRDPQALDTGEAIGSNVVGGMGGGAYLGLSASESCGAFAIFCAPVFAAAGATAGAIYGLGRGTITGLPEKKAEALEELLGELVLGKAPLAATFRDAVVTEMTSRWSVVKTSGVPEVMITFSGLTLKQRASDKLEFLVYAELVVRYGSHPKKDITEARHFGRSTPTHHVDDWLAENGILLNQELEKAVQSLASVLAEMLEPAPAQSE